MRLLLLLSAPNGALNGTFSLKTRKKREPPFFRTVPANPRLCQIREIFSQKIPVIFHIAVFFLPPMALLHDFRIGHLGNLLHAISIDAIVRKAGARGVA